MLGFLWTLSFLPNAVLQPPPPRMPAAAVAARAATERQTAVAVRGATSEAVRAATTASPETPAAAKPVKQTTRHRPSLVMPYAAAAGALFVTTWLVAIFYSLNALHGERRDRSLLFWKSLPVSDVTTVLAKATIPLVVQPLVLLVLAVGAQLVMLLLSSLVLLANGISPALLWAQLHLPLMWAMLPYGLLVNALWDAPFFGWLFLVSAWAKKNTFVWALAPWLALALLEWMVFQTRHVLGLLNYRVFGGYELAFTVHGDGKTPVSSFSQVDFGHFLANPALWSGLVFAAACFAGCVWLRRTRDPI
jgi:ABC-2 type transport system permease protein